MSTALVAFNVGIALGYFVAGCGSIMILSVPAAVVHLAVALMLLLLTTRPGDWKRKRGSG
jgi:hypothetical protein